MCIVFDCLGEVDESAEPAGNEKDEIRSISPFIGRGLRRWGNRRSGDTPGSVL